MTAVQTIIVARQTINLKPQTLTTADDRNVVVGAVVVYRIKDVERAIGRVNWGVNETIADITPAAVVDVVRRSTWAELSEVEAALRSACRRQMVKYGVFVSRCAFTDLAEARVFRLVQG